MITMRDHLAAKGIFYSTKEEAERFRSPRFIDMFPDEMVLPPLPSLMYKRKDTFKRKMLVIGHKNPAILVIVK